MKKITTSLSIALFSFVATAQVSPFFTTSNSIQYSNIVSSDSTLYYNMKETDNSTSIYALKNNTTTKLAKVANIYFSAGNLLADQSFAFKNKAGLLIQDYKTNRYTLWISDGTPSGTDSVFSFSNYLTKIYPGAAIGNDFYFTLTTDVTNTTDLYKTNFTKAGTIKIKSFANTRIFWPYVDNGNLYFHGYQGNSPSSQYAVLYKFTTDTVRLLTGVLFGQARVFNNFLYYPYSGSLLKKDLSNNTITTLAVLFNLDRIMGVLNNKIYVAGTMNTLNALNVGDEVYYTSGNVNDLTILKDLDNNTAGNGVPSLYFNFIFGNNAFYFVAKNPLLHYALFASDGSSTGTHVVQDLQIAGNPNLYSPSTMLICGDRLYFYRQDYSIKNKSYSNYALSTCDTTTGSLTLIDFASAGYPSPVVENVVNLSDKIVFTGNDGSANAYKTIFGINSCGSIIPSSIKIEQNNSTNFSIFPNPSNGNMKLVYDLLTNETVSIQVYNSLSQLVFEQENKDNAGLNEKIISLDQLPMGTYLLRATTEKNSFTKTISIVR